MLHLRSLALPVLALLVATAPAHARTERWPLPAAPQHPVPQGTTGLPGDDFATALPVPTLPFSVSGTTCGFANDPFPEGSCGAMPGPDVVYRYDATTDVHVIASTCDSPNPDQSTALVVYDASAPDTPICDWYLCGNNSRSYLSLRAGRTYYFVIDSFLSSLLEGVSLVPGETYYIVVSGYYGDCGDYALHASACAPTAVSARTWGQLKRFYR